MKIMFYKNSLIIPVFLALVS